MTVTAVIPTKNRPIDLLKAVKSIFEQNLAPDELLIIDQSESLEGYALIKEYLTSNNKLVPKVNHIHDPTISGLVMARQYAVDVAKGDLVLFLEDDVILEKDFTEKIVDGFNKKPEMMGSSGIILNYKPSFLYLFFHRIFHRGIFFDPRLDWHGSTEDKLITSTYLNGGLSAYKKEVFRSVPFDLKNDFFMVEDIEYSVRAADMFGKDKFFINSAAKLSHYPSRHNRSNTEAKYERKTRELIFFAKKRKQNYKTYIDLTWLLIGQTLEAGFSSVFKRNIDPIKGFGKGLLKGVRGELK